jgi:hypothetical protein
MSPIKIAKKIPSFFLLMLILLKIVMLILK